MVEQLDVELQMEKYKLKLGIYGELEIQCAATRISPGLKECMRRGYSYVDGIEVLLQNLKKSNYEMHAFTNYPIWYLMIEEKLKISTYLSWTFCSCTIGKRKPAAELYLEVSEHLGVDPAGCVFIDDRVTNVEAAVGTGMVGIHFKGATALREDLSLLGIQVDGDDMNKSINDVPFHAEKVD